MHRIKICLIAILFLCTFFTIHGQSHNFAIAGATEIVFHKEKNMAAVLEKGGRGPTGRCRYSTYPQHFSADGKKISDLATNDTFRNIIVSPDGTQFIGGGGRSAPTIFSLTSKNMLPLSAKSSGDKWQFTKTFAFNDQGTKVATSDRGRIRIHTIKGRLLKEYNFDYDRIDALAFAPDGNYLLASRSTFTEQPSKPSSVVVLKTKGRFKKVRRYAKSKPYRVLDTWAERIVFYPDGKRLAIINGAGLSTWSLKGELLAAPKYETDQ